MLKSLIATLPSVSVANLLTGNFTTPASYKSLEPHQILSSTSGMALLVGRNTETITLADFPRTSNISCSEFFSIATTGNSLLFSEFSFRPSIVGRYSIDFCQANVSSTSRMVAGIGGVGGGGTLFTECEYWTFASRGHSTNFGYFAKHGGGRWGAGNSTTGIFGGGNLSARGSFGGVVNDIISITIATLADPTTAWGSMAYPNDEMAAASSTTRFINGGDGLALAYGRSVDLEYGTIGTTGTIANFGDMSGVTSRNPAAASSSTRAIWSGGQDGGVYRVKSEYVTIATTGNATNFGDLATGRNSMGGNSNGTRMVVAGGYTTSSASLKSMEYYTIASTGTATSFGDMLVKRAQMTMGSNGHGGL